MFSPFSTAQARAAFSIWKPRAFQEHDSVAALAVLQFGGVSVDGPGVSYS
jgi:hypothetical protein